MNTIFECSYLSFGWEVGHPLSMYITRRMEGGEGVGIVIQNGLDPTYPTENNMFQLMAMNQELLLLYGVTQGFALGPWSTT